jgi:hypothetical protein
MWPGPNSHFFTPDPAECNAVMKIAERAAEDQPRWNYEGTPFSVFATGLGGCAAGKIPVWRAFNNGPTRGIESNHRYSIDRGVIAAMLADGWVDEGIAFCVDPTL